MPMKRKIKPIGTIKEELKACRKAWKANPKATFAWCCHHTVLVELLIFCGAFGRIHVIMHEKDTHEKAIRLRNFRPVRVKLPEGLITHPHDFDLAYHATRLKSSHTRDWPDHTWDGGTIFCHGWSDL